MAEVFDQVHPLVPSTADVDESWEFEHRVREWSARIVRRLSYENTNSGRRGELSMAVKEGLSRLKLVWAVIVLAAWVALCVLIESSATTSAMLGEFLLGTCVVAASLAGIPYLSIPIDAKVCLGIAFVWGGLSYAGGKWPDGAVFGVVVATIIYSVCWVVRGFQKRNS